MRLTAYKTALKQAFEELPNRIPKLERYFGDGYSPNRHAMQHILNEARKDTALLHCEFVEFYQIWNKMRKELTE